MVVIHKIFSPTQPLSVYSQIVHVDLTSAMEMINTLYLSLEEMRENVETKFRELFIVAEDLTNEIEEEMNVPRTVKRQVHRENSPIL